MHIAVSGNIGSGKTTLTRLLSDHYKWEPHFEDVDENPYLNDFYNDMQRWSFNLQVYFLTSRFSQILKVRESGKDFIQDRTIYEDAEVFARNLYDQGLMDERDFQTYWELYQNIRDVLRPPDLLICLVADVKTIRKRIRMRGREMEQNIPNSYLKRLNSLYEEWFDSYNLSPTVTISTNKIDYITDMVDRIDLLQKIEKHLSS